MLAIYARFFGGADIEINYKPVEWLGNKVRFLDQTLLPFQETYLETTDFSVIVSAITGMKIRGAPAIGVAAAYGIALGALAIKQRNNEACISELKKVVAAIRSTRPTARNLFFTIERMNRLISEINDFKMLQNSIVAEALSIHDAEVKSSFRISQFGAGLISNGMHVLTHCNTGPLATTGYGTALGVISYAFHQGKNIHVLVDETRPLFQGARLTVWELKKAGIPFSLITDSMAGSFMLCNQVDLAIVGADCIAANGDTANKIGTYSVAVLAKTHHLPFYIAAPTSTIDRTRKTGRDITIEERRPDEIIKFHDISLTLDGINVHNPAFDITPAKYITAIVTERGIIRKPYRQGLYEITNQVI